MACCIPAVAVDLLAFLEQHCEKVCKPKSTVLFNRGEKAFGVFLVLSGKKESRYGTAHPDSY